MTFDEVLEQVRELLQSKGRVAYRALKRRFEFDDEYLEDLKAELIDAEHVARDEDGKVLVWCGKGGPTQPNTVAHEPGPAPSSSASTSQSVKERPSFTAQQVSVPQREPAAVARAALDGERRQLTVEFIDLVGSTTLSQQLDPEELRTVMQAYRETCATVIRHFEGYLAKYIGDGLLVYFGYPQAHEDDAPRAVRAGLGIIAALPQLNARLQSTLGAHSCAPLQVRIGIHTGLVVAGEMGVGDQTEPLAIEGETPIIATRLQEYE